MWNSIRGPVYILVLAVNYNYFINYWNFAVHTVVY